MVALPARSPAIPLQSGLHARLTGDATLMGLIEGVFDGPPENVDGDYITIDESAETPDNTHSGFGSETLWTLRIWTKARGHRNGLMVEARLRELLDHQKSALDGLVAGHRVVAIRFASRQALVDPEPPGDTRHIPVTYRISTEQEPGS
jgi:uncharacterized protein DUF3168